MRDGMDARKRQSGVPLFFQILCFCIVTGFVLLAATLSVTLYVSLSNFQKQVEESLRATADSLASNPMVLDAYRAGRCSEELVRYLDELVHQTRDLDVLTLADAHSIRLYHVNHVQIGGTFVGGDQFRALEGESYFSDAVGTMGRQHRYLMPVRDTDGAILGFITASTTLGQLRVLRNEIIDAYLKMGVLLILALILFSGAVSLVLRRMLLGFTPQQLANTYLKQNEILNNLEEGIVSVDRTGRIQLMNSAAQRILGQPTELMEDTALDSVLLEENGGTLLGPPRENVSTSRPNVLANCIPLIKGGKTTGATIILRDKSEAMRRAEQLNGTRNVISTLRANSHEFMNQLQVISGLLQMDHTQEALEYIGDLSQIQTRIITPIMQHIQNPNVAALLLGKMGSARERDVRITLLPNSSLPEHSRYLSTAELVTVLGNLLENAIEAVNAQTEGTLRNVDMQITENAEDLLLQISDTGIGIQARQLDRIGDFGFSTKASQGRGVGMFLVYNIVKSREGSIDIDSEPGEGTSVTLIFSKKRTKE